MSGDLLSAKGFDGNVTFDGTVVVIERNRSKVDKRIPVGSITSVQWSPPRGLNGFILGNITFTIPGENFIPQQGVKIGKGVVNPNAVNFKKPAAKDFEVVRDAINAAIEKGSEDSNAPVVPQNPVSVGDELKKLVDLRDSGILTEAEFDAQKTKLLESD